MVTEHFLDNVKLESLTHLNLANNLFESLNLTMFFHIHFVELAGNPWSCTWLIEEMMSVSEGVHFGKNYSIDTNNPHEVLTVPGVDCIDESGKLRSIVILHIPSKTHNSYSENIIEEVNYFISFNYSIEK